MDETADTMEYLEGDEAFFMWDECPYELGTVEQYNWMRGFMDAWNDASEETRTKPIKRGVQP